MQLLKPNIELVYKQTGEGEMLWLSGKVRDEIDEETKRSRVVPQPGKLLMPIKS
jgi:hypothetical protein